MATAGVTPPGGAQRDGAAEAVAGASGGGGNDVRDGAGGSGAGGVLAGGGDTGAEVTGAGGGAVVTGGGGAGGVAGAVCTGCVPGAVAGVVLLESALPGTDAAGRPGSPGTNERTVVAGSFSFSLAFSSRSAASRFSRASRSLASRSAVSFSAASFWAFWPPLAGTIEPIRGVRVSSVATYPGSYWRPGMAAGSAPLTATLRSAPGRTFWLSSLLPPPNQPQPDRRTRADTPSRLRNKRKPPPTSHCRRITVTRCPSLERKFDPSVIAAYL